MTPPAGTVIRPAGPADAEAVCGLAAALSREEGDPPSPFTVDRYLADGFGPDPAFRVLLAERAGAAAGYAALCPTYDVATAARGVHLIDLYVVPAARRAGVGRALVAAVVGACRAGGGRWVQWSVRPENAAAKAFYRAVGGRRDRGVPMYLEVPAG